MYKRQDLRRLAAVLEEIADLEAQTTKLDTLRAEAEELKNRLTAKQALSLIHISGRIPAFFQPSFDQPQHHTHLTT